MQIEHCAELGDFCITTFCWPNFDSLKPVKYKEHIMKSEVRVDTDAAIVSLDSHLQLLQKAGSELKHVIGHPTNQVLIGLRASAVKNLEIVAVRLAKKEQDLIHEDLDTATKEEAEAARHSYEKMRPLGEKAAANRLSAEELVSTLNEQPNPILARRQFMSLGVDVATIFDDTEIIVKPNQIALPLKYSSEGQYTLEVMVAQFSPGTGTATFALISAFGKQPFFDDNDQGRNLVADIPNENDVTLVGLCASYRLPLKVIMTLEVSLKIKGQLPISGTVVRLENETKVIASIRQEMRQLNADLFEAV